MSQSNLTIDLACTGCSYNLRGLDRDKVCPECGQPISVTVHDRTAGRSQWLRRLSDGSLLIGLGLFIAAVALLAMTATRAAVWVVPAGVVVSAAGTWIFAHGGPRSFEPVRGRWLNTILRVAAIVTCTMQLQLLLTAQAALYRIYAPPSGWGLVLQVDLLLLSWGLAAVLTCQRAAMLARRIGDKAGMVQAWMLSILVPALVVIMTSQGNAASPAGMGMLIGVGIVTCLLGFWSAVFFVGFSLALRKAAAESMADDH